MLFIIKINLSMFTQYNRQSHRIFELNERGYHQASRNNSHQMWNLLGWDEEVPLTSSSGNKMHEDTFDTTLNQTAKVNDKSMEQLNKSANFSLTKNEDKPDVLQKTNKGIPQNQGNSQQADKQTRPNSFMRSGNQLKEKLERQPVIETELQKLKRKSIQKYLKEQVPYTRTLSNSAFRKFYQRPCHQAYGRQNQSTERGAFYGNFMKTHNVQPHTLDNQPQNYQTYVSALNFGKRTKLDLDDRWKKIERQLAKDLDYRELAHMKAVGEIDLNQTNKEDMLKLNIDHHGKQEGQKYQVAEAFAGSKSAKSLGKMETRATFQNTYNEDDPKSLSAQKKKLNRPLYYVYKYNEEGDGYNCTRYARDRHGITCYVDNAFRNNDQAYTQFMKRIKPIYPQKCKPEDMNIDEIRIQNCQKNRQVKEEIPQHYMMPVVDEPYMANKYSRKGKAQLGKTQ